MKEEMATISFFFFENVATETQEICQDYTSDFSLVQQLEKSKGASFNLL